MADGAQVGITKTNATSICCVLRWSAWRPCRVERTRRPRTSASLRRLATP